MQLSHIHTYKASVYEINFLHLIGKRLKNTQIIYQILEINEDFIVGSVTDSIGGFIWVVVADIPRKMVKFNRVTPQHVTLVSSESDDSFSPDFEKTWVPHMALRLRDWLLTYHPEKMYPYKNRQVGVDYNTDDSDYLDDEERKRLYLPPMEFFNLLFSSPPPKENND